VDQPFTGIYQLETVEQLRAIADPLRLRIVDQLARQAMTATQLGEALNLPANKVHYHVRELERVGLVKLVETREKGGILEKYYRLVAGDLQVPVALLRAAPPDESVAAVTETLHHVSQNFLNAFSRAVHAQEWDPGSLALSVEEVYLTTGEMRDLVAQMRALLKPFDGREPPSGATARSVVLLAYPAGTARQSEAPPPPPAEGTPVEPQAARPPRKPAEPQAPRPARVEVRVDLDPKDKGAGPRKVVAVGAFSYGRKELEEVAASGRPLDLNVLGYLTFAADISAELADHAISHIRHKGVLNAPPAVREVLKRKGG
jgi:DNA-binding transcriptional ArsR family regulator